ncbi:MAG: UbiA family prenyltransferase [Bacteroidia bacterium]|nr:UbiA family prenyltransferase [Bacteroidia bacterium]
MLSRSAWLHLRIPFSYFLLPVYLFSLCVSPNYAGHYMAWVFIIVHLFLYPASNGFNSYFDKDEQSIGGLKNPPPVSKGLYYLSLLFDVVAIVLGYLMVNLTFSAMLLIYGLVSKAYSHPAIRLKKHALAGWLTVCLFQGFFTFLMCYVGINNYGVGNLVNPAVLIPAALSSLLLGGTYPMTQVFQHDEDARRGDRTISLVLGVRGTFVFVGCLFFVASALFLWYFDTYFRRDYAYAFLLAMAPVVGYFLFWFAQVYRDTSNADFKRTMWLNFISATSLNGFFIFIFLNYRQVLQTL